MVSSRRQRLMLTAEPVCTVIFFTATMRSSSRSAALNTVPKDPLPTISLILKRLRGRAGAASPPSCGGDGGGGSGGGASEEAPSVVSPDAYMAPGGLSFRNIRGTFNLSAEF